MNLIARIKCFFLRHQWGQVAHGPCIARLVIGRSGTCMPIQARQCKRCHRVEVLG